MTPVQSLLIAHIATAQAMAERMEKIGNTEWAIKWHQIAQTLLAAWKPGGTPNGHR